MVPTLSQLEAWDTEHLINAATYWTTTANQWEDAFTQIRNQSHTMGWDGQGGDALRARTSADLTSVTAQADQLRNAAQIARTGASDISTAQRSALYAVEDAQNAGFQVGDDLSVIDTRSTTPAERATRQAQAVAFAADIRSRAEQLEGADSKVAGQLTASTAGVGNVGFGPAGAGVKLVDFNQNGDSQPPPLAPWDTPDGKQPPAAGEPPKPPTGPPTGLPNPLQDFSDYQLHGQPIPNPPAPNVTADQLRLALMQQHIEYDEFVAWFNKAHGGNVTPVEYLQRAAAFDAAAMGAVLSPAGGPLGMSAAAIGVLISGYQLGTAQLPDAQIPVPIPGQ